MKLKIAFVLILSVFIYSSCSSSTKGIRIGPDEGEKWIGFHLLHNSNDYNLDTISSIIPKLAKQGINILFYEVDYNFDFQSHPELRAAEKNISITSAARFSNLCRENDIRLIIQFQCFGHQSWAKTTFPLLTKYPHLDLTPGAYPNNDSIYCREWDPMNPQVYKIVLPMIDELIDAFSVDGIHVGLDEIFLINNPNAKSTRDKNPADVYAKVVNDLYKHLVKKRGMEMFMWGDRLIDGNEIKYGEWESSLNGTASAINKIPKDIIICDWHYESMDEYPSVPMFIKKGFRVLPSSWRDVSAAKALIQYSQKQKNTGMLGHLFTTWGSNTEDAITEGMKLLKK